ncbi:hypothetical protein AAK967_05345 [Atopobiaceae bacterium 24-176]
MDWHDELTRRVAAHYLEEHGPLSEGAQRELFAAVTANVDSFVSQESDRAFAVVVQAQDALAKASANDEFLSDEEYMTARAQRLDRLRASCDEALAIDPSCTDAALVRLLVTEADALEHVCALRALDDKASPGVPAITTDGADAWADVFTRPALRVRAALAVTALDAANVSMALSCATSLLDVMPNDELGMGGTAALALARLEDEEGFNELDARLGRRGSAWTNLGRALLLFKLDRLSAARRALTGFCSLNEGGAYALLRPTYVETYLPCRPEFAPGSFEEAVLAVHEADPVVVDAPDFINWTSEQPGVLDGAVAFARANGMDW